MILVLVMLVVASMATPVARADGSCVANIAFPTLTDGSGFCQKIIEPFNNYNCTEFMVSTYDGYLLSIQRIQRKNYSGPSFRGDVFFMHASLMGGSSWFLASSPTPLAVADAGFSVWIGNMRATEFSFGHQSLSPAQTAFWNWDMDELANYDLPAFMDFLNYATNGEKIHYVGFSQGARVGLGAISYQWNRAAELASLTLIAPVVYMTNTQSRVLLALNYTDVAELGYHIGEGRASIATMIDASANPVDAELLAGLEREVLCQFTGPNCCIDPHTAYAALTGPFSATTYKNLAHLTQSMRIQTFMAYDFGSSNANNQIYESQVPPKYHLAEVPQVVPIFVLYGGNDKLSTPPDVEFMISQLSTQPKYLFLPLYAHLDFLLSFNLWLDVNLPILNFLNSNTGNE